MSIYEDFHRPEKTQETDNEDRISKEAEMKKKKINRNQKHIIPWNIQLRFLAFFFFQSIHAFINIPV